MRFSLRHAVLSVLLFSSIAKAAETETQYLSGKGKDDPIQWEFMCDGGQNANKWSHIGVPSNWQLQGFGIYEYGQPMPAGGWPKVHGIYKRSFTTPANWRGKRIFLHFEGVMTDARVTVNGQSAGPIHQGGYYAFKYDVSHLLKATGQQNEIQVGVDDESANASVNGAERRADFWNYAGIFRPVYLEAVPQSYIDHLAINAAADGSLTVAATTAGDGDRGAASLEAQVLDNGKPVGPVMREKVPTLDGTTQLTGKFDHPRLWNAEFPNLYQLEVRLVVGGRAVHTVHQRFGFRTIEVKPGQGLFVNGHRVFLKGVTRHSFWPDSGRTLSEKVSRDDINLIKEMNGNAVRTSHYPPDAHFLEDCDELGVYVLDELAGWHHFYDDEVGTKLVKEMVEHDVNHPSVIFWDNGNEGGFNTNLDGEFAKHDPQQRVVLHPWQEFPKGIANTKHYPTYDQMKDLLSQDPVFFPTEMLHGLYDGGLGAGLNEYWAAVLTSKAGAGGFLWSFVDEDVKRVDKGGILDSAGNQAPDGIVGPYREKEGSYFTAKQVWSPMVVTPQGESAKGYVVSNRYSFANASQCTFQWELIAFHKPSDIASGAVVLASRMDHGRALGPGETAVWQGWGPPALSATQHAKGVAEATRLRIRDYTGRVIQTYVWPTGEMARASDVGSGEAKTAVTAEDSSDAIHVTAGTLSLAISKTTGLIAEVTRDGKPYSLAGGPRVVAMSPRPAPVRRGQTAPPAPPPAMAPASSVASVTQKHDGDDVVVTAEFAGPMKSIRYRVKPSGWVDVDYQYSASGPQEYFGVGFDYPEAKVKGMRYLGEGPSTVYQNRLGGGVLDVWDKAYNNTMVGDPDDLKPGEHFNYPVFKGYYTGVRWLELNTAEGPITVMVDQRENSPVYVQVMAPKTASQAQVGQAYAIFPQASISFLNAISAIGSKFVGPLSSGPTGQPAVAKGEYTGAIRLYFGQLPRK